MRRNIASTGWILILAAVGCNSVRVSEAWVRDDRPSALELRPVRPDAEVLFEQILPQRLEELGKKREPSDPELLAAQELSAFWSGFRFLDRILHGDLTTADATDLQRRHGISVRRAKADEALQITQDGRTVPSRCAIFVGPDALLVFGAAGRPFEVNDLLQEREHALRQIEEVAAGFNRAVENGIADVRESASP